MSDNVILCDMLKGRAQFCEDRGEVKTPELLRMAAAEIDRMRDMCLNILCIGVLAGEKNAALDDAKHWARKALKMPDLEGTENAKS